MRRETKSPHDDERYTLGIYEVYYNTRDRIKGWTKDAMDPHGNTLKELSSDLAFMKRALTAPILDYKTGKPIKGERS
jgi:hypothetical protein